jgi:transposase
MLDYEPHLSFATVIRGRTARIAAAGSRTNHFGRSVPAVSSYLAAGRRVQHQGSGPERKPPLYERTQMGKAVSSRRPGRSAGPDEDWPTESPRRGRRGVGHQDGHLSPGRFGLGFHHLVVGQTGNTFSATRYNCPYQPRDDTAYPIPSRSSVPDRPNLVRKRRSRIRGKKNAIIHLYRHPPHWGQVVCFDEMGPLQTIPRGGKAWGRRCGLRPDRYKRNGTLQWFSAFCPHTGLSIGKGFPTKSADCCRAFWLEHMLPFWPRGGVHLVMDNLSAHKKALRELPARIRRRIHVYWTPTNSSWLNLIESYFATLQRTGLHNTDYKSPDEIEQGLRRATIYLNENPRAYNWKKI